jgi:putative tryptophan/tyrosine transport system substrate-binding protein
MCTDMATRKMKRRDFITLLGGASAWPLAARAQQSGAMRRIGVLTANREDDPQTRAWLSAFVQRLAELGWNEGRNLRMEVRWAAGDRDRMRTYTQELVELQPDAVLMEAAPQTGAPRVPLVFVIVPDPVGSDVVASANIIGFTSQEPTMAGKWVELLGEIAPSLRPPDPSLG